LLKHNRSLNIDGERCASGTGSEMDLSMTLDALLELSTA